MTTRAIIFNKTGKGFTLVELLVTIGIVALILVVSIPSFRNYKDRNDLFRGAEIVQSAIYETRSLALSPQATKDNSTQYYMIKINHQDSFEIYESPDIDMEDSNLKLVKTIYLPTNIVLSEVPEDIDNGIYFSIVDQGKIVGLSNDIEFSISSTKIDNEKIIKINRVTGQVVIK
jgi:prepilin-type N-terminal cleavage/methylation domain-containing protein